MSRSTISTLSLHGVRWRVSLGKLEAFDVVTGPGGEDLSCWVDLTEYSLPMLYRWLGY